MFHGLRRSPIAFNELIGRTYAEVLADDVLGMAAQLAYFMALALFPALIVIVALVSYLPWSILEDVVAAIGRIAPAEIVQLVKEQLNELANGNNGGLLTVGVLAALWTSSSALVSIVQTLNRAYDVTDSRSWWRIRLRAIALTIGLAIFIVTATMVLLAGPYVTTWIESTIGFGSMAAQVWSIAQYPLAFAVASLGFAIVYYYAPDVEQDWVWITPGSIGATALWLVFTYGLRIYIERFGNYNETYGALGGAAILLLWMYLSGLAVLIGGELNAEIEHALPEGKEPGERVPGQRLRLHAFARTAPLPRLEAPQPSRVL